MVVCLFCPLVISASPTWWSSRHALACQLKMGPQSTLRVPQSLQSCFFLTCFPSNQHPTETTSLFLLSNSGGAHCAEFIKLFSLALRSVLYRGGSCSAMIFSGKSNENKEILFGFFCSTAFKSGIKMQMRVSLK